MMNVGRRTAPVARSVAVSLPLQLPSRKWAVDASLRPQPTGEPLHPDARNLACHPEIWQEIRFRLVPAKPL